MKFITIALVACVVLVGCAKKEELQTASISLPTIVCGMCSGNVEKAMYGVSGVKAVDVNLDGKSVEVKFVPLQTNTETIVRAINGAGYDANGSKADPIAYEKLDACCKIDG